MVEPRLAFNQTGRVEDPPTRDVDLIKDYPKFVLRPLQTVELVLEEWHDVLMCHETSLGLMPVVGVPADYRDRPPPVQLLRRVNAKLKYSGSVDCDGQPLSPQ